MKRTSLLIVAAGLCGLFTVVNSTRAQGTAFTYQGRLNTNGVPATGSYDLTFKLFSDGGGTTQIGSPIADSAVPVSNGLFTVTLDFGANFPGTNRYLKISVRTNGVGTFTDLTPLQPLTPSPYAIFAGAAASATLATTATTAASSTTATNFSGALTGDVTGPQSATVVAKVGGQTEANVAAGVIAANAATSADTGGSIVQRDASGSFSASEITLSAPLNLEPLPSIVLTGGNLFMFGDTFGNFFAGQNAGNVFPLSGGQNTAIGWDALDDIGSGSENTAVGFSALIDNTSGIGNTAVGDSALFFSSVSTDNTALGVSALYENTTGSNNTATGADALYSNTSGNFNTANGMDALYLNANGSFNTACGLNTLAGNVSGMDNSAFGVNALFSNNGSQNTALGDSTLSFNVSGNSNTACGEGALFQLPAGNANTAIGTTALGNITNGSGNIGLGYSAGGNLFSGSNNIYIGNGGQPAETGVIRIGTPGFQNQTILTGNVGIDTSPLFTLDMVESSAVTRMISTSATFGSVLELRNVSPGSPSLLGAINFNNVADTFPGQIAYTFGNTMTFSVNGNTRMTIDGNGNVGIGRVSTGNQLELSGNASKAAAGSWLANSDRRIKTDITTVTNALDTLDRVRLIDFRYTDDYRASHPAVADRHYLNVVAQEFSEVFPEWVKGSGEKMPDGSQILQVDTYPLTIYSAAAVQELHAQLRQKDRQIQALTDRLDALERAVQNLAAAK